MRKVLLAVIISFVLPLFVHAGTEQIRLTYRIVDTGVFEFYDNSSVIPRPKPGDAFFGQDAQYQINNPSYTFNGDGTITDKITGLIWQNTMGGKLSFEEGFHHLALISLMVESRDIPNTTLETVKRTECISGLCGAISGTG